MKLLIQKIFFISNKKDTFTLFDAQQFDPIPLTLWPELPTFVNNYGTFFYR